MKIGNPQSTTPDQTRDVGRISCHPGSPHILYPVVFIYGSSYSQILPKICLWENSEFSRNSHMPIPVETKNHYVSGVSHEFPMKRRPKFGLFQRIQGPAGKKSAWRYAFDRRAVQNLIRVNPQPRCRIHSGRPTPHRSIHPAPSWTPDGHRAPPSVSTPNPLAGE